MDSKVYCNPWIVQSIALCICCWEKCGWGALWHDPGQQLLQFSHTKPLREIYIEKSESSTELGCPGQNFKGRGGTEHFQESMLGLSRRQHTQHTTLHTSTSLCLRERMGCSAKDSVKKSVREHVHRQPSAEAPPRKWEKCCTAGGPRLSSKEQPQL